MSISARAIAVLPVLLSCALWATTGYARVLEVGPDKTYKLPSEAAAVAQDGDTVLISSGRYLDCAVWRANRLVISGTASDASAIISDKTCMGKALFVILGRDVVVRNLTMTRARAPDMNGAGLRAEGVNLLVEGVRFVDNQDGILAAPEPSSTIIVRDSSFERNGTCEAACAHGIYAGRVKLLQVVNSRFTLTREGHHIKSRALRTEVIGCDISDGSDGTASYLIDVPNGGTTIIQGNSLDKGPRSGNHLALIRIGAEGVTNPTEEILITDNRVAAAQNYRTTFVVNDTATPATLRSNAIAPGVRAVRGDSNLH